eukprot:4230621-Pyramimonas_sp.AAC.2
MASGIMIEVRGDALSSQANMWHMRNCKATSRTPRGWTTGKQRVRGAPERHEMTHSRSKDGSRKKHTMANIPIPAPLSAVVADAGGHGHRHEHDAVRFFHGLHLLLLPALLPALGRGWGCRCGGGRRAALAALGLRLHGFLGSGRTRAKMGGAEQSSEDISSGSCPSIPIPHPPPPLRKARKKFSEE